jgi:hypothetical protein
MSDPGFTRPDLCSIRVIASRAESAEAARGVLSADGYPLAGDDPLAPLARDVARTLIEAGVTLRHCDRHDPLYRSGGVRLMPIPAESGTGRSGIAASWTARNLLMPGRDRYGTYRRPHQLVTAAPGGVLGGFAYSVQQSGADGAWLVTGRRGKRTEAGR